MYPLFALLSVSIISCSSSTSSDSGSDDTSTGTNTNNAPTATNDTAQVTEGQSVIITPLSNDSDSDGDALTITSTTSPAHGSVVINPDQTISFTADNNYNGPDNFNYTITDGSLTATAQINVTINSASGGSNNKPDVSDDIASVHENNSVDINVILNDSDADNDTLLVTSVDSPSSGTTSIIDQNTIRYTAAANFSGEVEFEYTVSDSKESETGEIKIYVHETADMSAKTPSDPAFITTKFEGASSCATCHNAANVEIVDDWETSIMANASRDPFWQAKVSSELERNPHLANIINDKCTECHAPMANRELKAASSSINIFDAGGILDSASSMHDAAMDGVSCTTCHQIEDDGNLGTLDGFSGNYSINSSKHIYGKFSPQNTSQMISNTNGYTPVLATHISESEMCATCHNLKTPFVDENGNIASSTPESEFPEQMIYTEWENSVFDGASPQSCQDCHMPQKDGVKISTMPGFISPRDNFSMHYLVGGNTTMLDMMQNNKAALGIDASKNFATTITRTRNLLQTAANIEIVASQVVNNELEVQLRITNNSGHKFPSGYPSRRAYIHFVVRDNNNNVVFESGKLNSNGSITGVDADFNLETYEPHYNEITSENQVQVYEPIMGNTDNEVTYTLLRSAAYLKDNRIPPEGFIKSTVPDDIKVAGAANSDSNFDNGSDLITYRIPVSSGITYSVTANLNYQPLAYAFVADLFKDLTPQVSKFKQMYDSSTLYIETVDTVSANVN